MSIKRELNLSSDVKIWTLNLDNKAPGMAVGTDFTSMAAGKGFVSCFSDKVTIGGDKVNMQISPGQMKWMGGLFRRTPFPLNLVPVAPQDMVDPEILLSIIDLAGQIVEGFALMV
jgi:hypothetical protein